MDPIRQMSSRELVKMCLGRVPESLPDDFDPDLPRSMSSQLLRRAAQVSLVVGGTLLTGAMATQASAQESSYSDSGSYGSVSESGGVGESFSSDYGDPSGSDYSGSSYSGSSDSGSYGSVSESGGVGESFSNDYGDASDSGDSGDSGSYGSVTESGGIDETWSGSGEGSETGSFDPGSYESWSDFDPGTAEQPVASTEDMTFENSYPGDEPGPAPAEPADGSFITGDVFTGWGPGAALETVGTPLGEQSFVTGDLPEAADYPGYTVSGLFAGVGSPEDGSLISGDIPAGSAVAPGWSQDFAGVDITPTEGLAPIDPEDYLGPGQIEFTAGIPLPWGPVPTYNEVSLLWGPGWLDYQTSVFSGLGGGGKVEIGYRPEPLQPGVFLEASVGVDYLFGSLEAGVETPLSYPDFDPTLSTSVKARVGPVSLSWGAEPGAAWPSILDDPRVTYDPRTESVGLGTSGAVGGRRNSEINNVAEDASDAGNAISGFVGEVRDHVLDATEAMNEGWTPTR